MAFPQRTTVARSALKAARHGLCAGCGRRRPGLGRAAAAGAFTIQWRLRWGSRPAEGSRPGSRVRSRRRALGLSCTTSIGP